MLDVNRKYWKNKTKVLHSKRYISYYKITSAQRVLWLVNTRVWIRVFKHGNFPRNVFLLNNYCGYFIKELPNGFLCLDNMIQTLEMLLDFRKAIKTLA